VLTLLLFACASRAILAAGTPVSGTVTGTDQGFLTGAVVAIDGSLHRETKTDADGRFTFADVPRGRYRIVVSAEGYLPLDQPLDVGDASVSVDIVLLRIPSLP
jgi:iron complex outermembrane receptor protein